jgi:protein ImuA
MSSTVPLAVLRSRIRRIERPSAAAFGVLPFGVAALDRSLPGGGLPLGAVHEIIGAGGDEEDGAAAAGFAAGILGRIGLHGDRPHGDKIGAVLWCLRRPDLYGPGLAAHGLDPARLVLVSAPRDDRILWVLEEGLRGGQGAGLAAVVGEIGRLPMVASRRLQLAAERAGVTVLLLRRWRTGDEAAAERGRPSAAMTRWRVASLPAAAIEEEPGIGRPRWRVELLRCRGGRPAECEVEVADATGFVSLPAELADRPAAPFAPHPGPLPASGAREQNQTLAPRERGEGGTRRAAVGG